MDVQGGLHPVCRIKRFRHLPPDIRSAELPGFSRFRTKMSKNRTAEPRVQFPSSCQPMDACRPLIRLLSPAIRTKKKAPSGKLK